MLKYRKLEDPEIAPNRRMQTYEFPKQENLRLKFQELILQTFRKTRKLILKVETRNPGNAGPT